jgi:proliferating cell nuclear antigen
MFEAKLSDGFIFKKIIDSIKDIVDVANIHISKNGIEMQAMDGSHVALVSLKLSKEGFDSFKCTKDQVLGINVKDFSKFIKFVEQNDSLLLRAKPNATTLYVESVSAKNQNKVEFEYRLQQLDEENLSVPEQQYDSCITINSNLFTKHCRDLRALDDTVKIEVKEDKVLLSVEASNGTLSILLNDSASQNSAIDDDRQNALKVQVSNPNIFISQQFALGYLELFNKAGCLGTFTRLHLMDGEPLITEFIIDGLGNMKFFLAPKIKSE